MDRLDCDERKQQQADPTDEQTQIAMPAGHDQADRDDRSENPDLDRDSHIVLGEQESGHGGETSIMPCLFRSASWAARSNRVQGRPGTH